MLRQPSFPEKEFDQVKRQTLTAIDTQRTDPQSLASLTIGRHLNPYPPEHWLYTPTLEERTARTRAATIEEARRCHADLVGASHSELVVVGDFDPDKAARSIERTLSSWKAGAQALEAPALPDSGAARTIIVNRPGSTQASLIIAQTAVAGIHMDVSGERMLATREPLRVGEPTAA